MGGTALDTGHWAVLYANAVYLVGLFIPHVPVGQCVLSRPIPLRVVLVAPPELVTLVRQVVQRMIISLLLEASGLKVDEGQDGAITLIKRFGSVANLDFHLNCLVLDEVNRCGADGMPTFVLLGL